MVDSKENYRFDLGVKRFKPRNYPCRWTAILAIAEKRP